MKQYAIWCNWYGLCTRMLMALICLAAFTPTHSASAATDYTADVAVASSTATIWFAPTAPANTTWVDVHYQLNAGGQQNLRMATANARYEQKVNGVANGNVIRYWFTYNKGTAAYDSPAASYTVGSTTPPPPPPPPPNTGTWNGRTTFNMVNGTRGAYPDNKVFWAIIGRDTHTGRFVHVDAAGNLVPMSVSDNGALVKNGQSYTNYFHSLAQTKSVTIPTINSARLMLSVGSPMYIKVNSDVNGNIGYAGANIENPSDPNIDVYFDFVEMAIIPNQGFFGNTTRVDHFGFPVLLRLQGLNGYDKTVGETDTRASIFSKFVAEVPAPFQGLAKAPYAPYRIIAPAHASFNNGAANSHYLDGYIAALWSKYSSQSLTFTNQQGTFTGRVVGNRFQFSDGKGTYFINQPPTTAMALLGNGALNDASGTTPGTPAYDKQLQIQAQMCAAINRHIVEDPAHWNNPAYYYPANQAANAYAKFWHDHSVSRLAYGFAYDDVWEQSSSLHTTAPTTATVTIGW